MMMGERSTRTGRLDIELDKERARVVVMQRRSRYFNKPRGFAGVWNGHSTAEPMRAARQSASVGASLVSAWWSRRRRQQTSGAQGVSRSASSEVRVLRARVGVDAFDGSSVGRRGDGDCSQLPQGDLFGHLRSMGPRAACRRTCSFLGRELQQPTKPRLIGGARARGARPIRDEWAALQRRSSEWAWTR